MYKFTENTTVFIRSRQNLYYVASEWVQNVENTPICTVTFKLVGGKNNNSDTIYPPEPFDEYPHEQTLTYDFIVYGLLEAIDKFSTCEFANEVEEIPGLRKQLLLNAKPFLSIGEVPFSESN